MLATDVTNRAQLPIVAPELLLPEVYIEQRLVLPHVGVAEQVAVFIDEACKSAGGQGEGLDHGLRDLPRLVAVLDAATDRLRELGPHRLCGCDVALDDLVRELLGDLAADFAKRDCPADGHQDRLRRDGDEYDSTT